VVGWERGGEEGGGSREEGEAGRNANSFPLASAAQCPYGPAPVRSSARRGGGVRVGSPPRLLAAPLTVGSGLGEAPLCHGAREEDAEDQEQRGEGLRVA